ncbi:MAG: hypothetical protein ACQERC_04015 [Bacteroidota bacterium]
MKAQRFILVFSALIAVHLHAFSQLSKSLSLSFESSFYKPKDYLGHLENASILERFGFSHDIGASYLISKDKSTFSFGFHYQRALLNYTEGFIETNGNTTVEHEREESYDVAAFSLGYLYGIGQKNEPHSFHLSFGIEVSYAFHYQKQKEAHRSTHYDPSSTKPLLEREVVSVNNKESTFEVNRYGLYQLFLRPRAGFVYSNALNEKFSLDIGTHFILGSVINQEEEVGAGIHPPAYDYDNGDFRDWWSFSLRVGLRYSL